MVVVVVVVVVGKGVYQGEGRRAFRRLLTRHDPRGENDNKKEVLVLGAVFFNGRRSPLLNKSQTMWAAAMRVTEARRTIKKKSKL